MASVRSRLVNTALRITSRLAFESGGDVNRYRARVARTDARRAGTTLPGIVMEDQEGPVAGRWLRDRDDHDTRVILYLHGGAFILRLPASHSALVDHGFHADQRHLAHAHLGRTAVPRTGGRGAAAALSRGKEPHGCPGIADLWRSGRLPPLLLVVGGVEALRDDSVGYVRKAVEAGVPARWHIWQGMPHVHMLMPFLPEAALAERELFAWLDGVAELKRSDSGEPAWRDAVTLFNRRPVTGTLRRSTNSEHVFQRSADSGLV